MNAGFIFQNSILRDRRKELRKNATEAEKILRQFLKGSKLGGLKFTRQYSVGPYILDFYCPKVRLAIELDGEQHKNPEARIYDKDRDDYLRNANIQTIRFWNDEIISSPEGALKSILSTASEGRPPA